MNSQHLHASLTWCIVWPVECLVGWMRTIYSTHFFICRWCETLHAVGQLIMHYNGLICLKFPLHSHPGSCLHMAGSRCPGCWHVLPLCYEQGMLGYYRPSTDVMGICVSNHKGDYKELGDTLRHESIHVAQACNNGKPILRWNQIAKYSNNRILSIVQRYPAEHQHIEYEAFTAAYVMSNNQIADIVKQQCSHLL